MKNLATTLLLTLILCHPVQAHAQNIEFNVPVEAVYFTDSADVDGDGADDVIISAQIDAFAQLGIKCCEVPASSISKIIGVIPQIYLSNYGEPKLVELPNEAETHRAWAGKFFNMNEKLYYIHGKNGELGLPSQNRGEQSQIYQIENLNGNVQFKLVATFPYFRTTASLDVRIVNGGAEIIQNNYNSFRASTLVYRSHKYIFTNNEELQEINPDIELRSDIAHNEIKFSRVLDGFTLTSTEVWKNNVGSETLTQNPASYYINKQRQIDMVPVPYEENHAGFSSEELIDEKAIYLLELSTEFFGHQSGGYKGSVVTAYKVDSQQLALQLCTENCITPKINLPMTTQVYLRRIDINFDGVDEIYVTGYKDNGVHLFYLEDGNLRQINSKRFSLKNPGGWYGRLHLLRDINRKCVSSISSISNFSQGKKVVQLKTSSCRQRRL